MAALDSDRTDGILLLGTIWLTNQVVGFGFLGYPLEAQAFAWGLAMGLGTLAAYFAARACVAALSASWRRRRDRCRFAGRLPRLPGGSVCRRLGAAQRRRCLQLSTSLAYVGLVEVVAYIVLLTAHRLAVSAGLLGPNAVEGAV